MSNRSKTRASRRAKPSAQQQSKRNVRKQPAKAPLGLESMFCALQPEGFRQAFGHMTADNFAGVPTAWLEAAQHGDADRRCHELLAAVANREDPDGRFGPDRELRASECAEVLSIVAFWCGVATCWYVMTAIEGKDGAR